MLNHVDLSVSRPPQLEALRLDTWYLGKLPGGKTVET